MYMINMFIGDLRLPWSPVLVYRLRYRYANMSQLNLEVFRSVRESPLYQAQCWTLS